MTGSLAVAGVTPRDVVMPATIDELAEIVRGLHTDRRAFAFVGGGTELELGNAPRTLDTVVRASQRDLEAVEGVGAVRAREIREGLRRLQEHNLVDRYLQL